MVGRALCSEAEALARGYRGAELAQRRRVLAETLAAFANAQPADRYRRIAEQNLGRWKAESFTNHGPIQTSGPCEIRVLPGDWGEVTLAMTQRYGECFAVLNMANAFVPGGAYVEGTVAQEENMFRRTDCHFSITEAEYDLARDRYRPEMTALLSAAAGRVYLDTAQPRICLRGAEDRQRPDLGYAWLPDDQIFPFFELRAAALDLRDGSAFDPVEMRRRIDAQLDTLREARVAHAVLGAFGCGAFRNPADQVASLYRQAIEARRRDFRVIAFAVFHAGYGPDNFTPFANALQN